MNVSDLFPYVVPKGYLRIPGGKKQPSLDKWGIVEPIGADLFRMLIDASGGMVRNVHEEDLAELGLSVEEGKAKAIENLRAMVEGGEDFQRQLSMSEDGLGHIVWMGHWLTASCIVLPELHGWTSKHLKTDEMLVSVPQQQFMFLFSVGDAGFRRDMRRYIKKVVEGMEKLITFDLFLLTKRGLEPYTEPRKG